MFLRLDCYNSVINVSEVASFGLTEEHQRSFIVFAVFRNIEGYCVLGSFDTKREAESYLRAIEKAIDVTVIRLNSS